uniref:Col_cuticle_N domain-containing protein n=1 Tax=Panagrellus redivivus TaxID=6233 RepID=A0A7E4VVJ1_PANRE
MISSKLLVFGIAFAFFTFLFVDFYQSHDGASNGRVGVNFSFDFYLEAVDGISADDVLNLPTYAQKFMCYLKLVRVVSAYQTMDYTTESGFTQLCKSLRGGIKGLRGCRDCHLASENRSTVESIMLKSVIVFLFAVLAAVLAAPQLGLGLGTNVGAQPGVGGVGLGGNVNGAGGYPGGVGLGTNTQAGFGKK